jgi:uncharacterized protein with HEPN domain
MIRRQRRLSERIQDMPEAIGNVESDICGLTKDAFLADGKTQRAVIESLIVIGEASGRILQKDPPVEDTYPELWQQLKDAYDMRIILTHEYFRVDAVIVWTFVCEDLPRLKA